MSALLFTVHLNCRAYPQKLWGSVFLNHMGGFDPLCIPTESERLSKNEKIFADISVQKKAEPS
jgi:hypothetical protein